MSIKIDTIIRTICLCLALVNQCLSMAGYKVLPITDDQVSEAITLGFTIVTSLWAWWKNNSFTKAALVADEIMHDIKDGNIEYADEGAKN